MALAVFGSVPILPSASEVEHLLAESRHRVTAWEWELNGEWQTCGPEMSDVLEAAYNQKAEIFEFDWPPPRPGLTPQDFTGYLCNLTKFTLTNQTSGTVRNLRRVEHAVPEHQLCEDWQVELRREQWLTMSDMEQKTIKQARMDGRQVVEYVWNCPGEKPVRYKLNLEKLFQQNCLSGTRRKIRMVVHPREVSCDS